eukprot:c23612_g3_i2 orf=640-840(+)
MMYMVCVYTILWKAYGEIMHARLGNKGHIVLEFGKLHDFLFSEQDNILVLLAPSSSCPNSYIRFIK